MSITSRMDMLYSILQEYSVLEKSPLADGLLKLNWNKEEKELHLPECCIGEHHSVVLGSRDVFAPR